MPGSKAPAQSMSYLRAHSDWSPPARSTPALGASADCGCDDQRCAKPHQPSDPPNSFADHSNQHSQWPLHLFQSRFQGYPSHESDSKCFGDGDFIAGGLRRVKHSTRKALACTAPLRDATCPCAGTSWYLAGSRDFIYFKSPVGLDWYSPLGGSEDLLATVTARLCYYSPSCRHLSRLCCWATFAVLVRQGSAF